MADPVPSGAAVETPLPTGTVALLFTDIEGSTLLFHALGDRMVDLIEVHNGMIRAAVDAHGGVELKTGGDGIIVAFASAPAAVRAAIEAQRSLLAHPWPEGHPVRVRMGVHYGPVTVVGRDYLGVSMAVCARVSAAAHGSQILLSAEAADAVAGTLPDGVSLTSLGEHRFRGFPEARALFEIRHPELPSGFPPPVTLSATPHNLPTPPTPIVGRREIIGTITGLLASDATIVTLTGIGGIGKTRVALEVARNQLAYRPGGVWFCDLAPVSDPTGIEPAIARALGIGERPGTTVREQIIARLGQAPVLLVLDNFEQVLSGAGIVEELVIGAPGVGVLVTSRERLGLADERIVELEPLSMPGHDLETSEALALFVERARAARTGFGPDEATSPGAIAVVERCQGIPLAIELAAAHIRSITPGEIAAKLGAGIDLLAEGDRDLPPRHRALRACIDWSYDTLDPATARALRALATFVGGAPLDAVDRVCGEGTKGVVARLAERSLVRLDGGRISMLEPLRLYGLERLREADETGDVVRRHAEWMRDLATEATKAMTGPDQTRWLARLESENDNARAALARPSIDPEVRAAIAVGMSVFWSARGHWRESKAWLEGLLEEGDGVPSGLRCRALVALAETSTNIGLFQQARDQLDRAERLAEGDAYLEGRVWTFRGNLARSEGKPVEGAEHLARALEAVRGTPDELVATINLAISRITNGEIDGPEEELARALEVARTRGDTRLINRATLGLASIMKARGDRERAGELFAEVLRAERSSGSRATALSALNSLTITLMESDRLPEAIAGFEELVAESRALGDLDMVAAGEFNLSEALRLNEAFEAAQERALVAAEVWGSLGNTMWQSQAYARAAAACAARGADGSSDLLERSLALTDDDAVLSQVLFIYAVTIRRAGLDGWRPHLERARQHAVASARADHIEEIDALLTEPAPTS